jgi:hypothetical protein
MSIGMLGIRPLRRGRAGVRRSCESGRRREMSLRRMFRRLRPFMRCWMGSDLVDGET